MSTPPAPLMSADIVRSWRAAMSTQPLPTDDFLRVELLRAAEELKGAAAALQARVTVAFAASQRTEQEAAGVDRRDVGRGIAAQVGLARRESPFRGARDLGLAEALVRELPLTLQALTAGETSEWRATLVARETACLSSEDRSVVDAELAARPGGLGAMGDRDVETTTRGIAHRLDPYAATRRARKAEADRRVSLRPAPDTMSNLTGLLPVRQGVAAFAALGVHADSLRSSGDPRTREQIMADTLVERLTGQATADAVPLEVQLVMTDRSLFDTRPAAPSSHTDGARDVADTDDTDSGRGQHSGADVGTAPRADVRTTAGVADAELREAPARVPGFGPVPAPLARSWIRDSVADVWIRRLFADPDTGVLVAMESRRRTFTGQLRAFVIARDQVCRTPWCDAPIRQVDHVIRAADGGPTSADNGQSLCQACNLAREAPHWQTTRVGESVLTTTPTSHEHSSGPPSHAPPDPRRPSTSSSLVLSA